MTANRPHGEAYEDRAPIRLVGPADPPALTPIAAVALLRMIRNVVDRQDSENQSDDDRKAA